ncbi:expansin-like protein [Gelatoporia subvermispora B]|uniref:Expansin-like protein n=1 Tax=Ceriporiopsis subvermispora (strain B) TaxID=914234 RepID=M2PV42_CERS8|nr:expansin-like protein [Gelatoporia subvermispora B]
MARIGSVLTAVLVLAALMTCTVAADISAYHTALRRAYTTAHSLSDNYQFDPRDGWQSVNVTNMQYARTTTGDSSPLLSKRSSKKSSHAKKMSKKAAKKSSTKVTSKKAKTSKTSSKKASSKTIKSTTESTSKDTKSVSDSGLSAVSGLVSSTVTKIVDSIKAVGNPEKVEITWYTGHDLLNPSCWSNPTWNPTDESFAAAVTLSGWKTKPECFKFLELCNSPKKCVFVRVVDSCAGCAAGSKHVDLTKAAFTQLADLDEGVLNVQMRKATDPDGWYAWWLLDIVFHCVF